MLRFEIRRPLSAALIALACFIAPAWADNVSLTSAWTKIASAGQTVSVQVLSVSPVRLQQSATAPSTSDGDVMVAQTPAELRKFDAPLPNDLYAMALGTGTGTVSVMPIGTAGAGGGSVTQGSPPWAQNVTQFGGSSVATGTGASGVGVPRVTVANDSVVLATQGTSAGASAAWPMAIVGLGGSTIGIQPAVTSTAAASLVIKASGGNLYSAWATNLTATAGFFVLANITSAPASGTAITPLDCVALPANATVSISYNPGPAEYFTTGITAMVTSAANCFTFTSGTITAFIKGSYK